MKFYAKSLPRDKDGAVMDQYAIPASALGRYGSENATASSVVTLTDNTTSIEVLAQGAGAVLRWVGAGDTQGSVISAASGANFDNAIGSNTVRRFAVPIERFVQTPSTIGGANTMNGLFARVALKSLGTGSVLLAEF